MQRPIEDADLGAVRSDSVKEGVRRAQSADAVDQETNGDAAIGGGTEGGREPLTDLVVAEDVPLEVDGLGGTVDELDHAVEGRHAVAEELDAVAA